MDLLVSKVLKKVLSNYIKSCPGLGSGNDIKIGSNSSIQLREVQLKENVIGKMLMLPKSIELQEATCDEMNVTVPLALMKKPIVIQINGVHVSAKEINLENNTKTVIVIKNSSKKSKRQVIDTILIDISDFTFEYESRDLKIIISFESFCSYFADNNFKKIDEIATEVADKNVFTARRVVEIKNINVRIIKNDKEFYLIRNMNVDVRITQTRDEDTYQLLETNIVLNINRLRLVLLTEEYIITSSFITNFISMYTSSFMFRNEETNTKQSSVGKKLIVMKIGTFEITVKNEQATEILRFVTEQFRGNISIESNQESNFISISTGVGMVEMMYESNGVGKRVLSAFGDNVFNTELGISLNNGVLSKMCLKVLLDGIEVSLESSVIMKLVDFVKLAIIDKLDQSKKGETIEKPENKQNNIIEVSKVLFELIRNRLTMISQKFGHKSFMDVLERSEMIVDIKNCVLSIPFGEGGGCNLYIDGIEFNNIPKFEILATNKYSKEVINRDLGVVRDCRKIKYTIGINGIKVIHINEKGEKNEIISPIKAIYNGIIGFEHSPIPLFIDFEGIITNIQVKMNSMMYSSLNKYFIGLFNSINSVIGAQFNQIAEEVSTKSSSIVDSVISHLNQYFLPLLDSKNIPRICLNLTIKNGSVDLPFTTILSTTPKETSSELTFQNMSFICVGDSEQRGFCLFLDNCKTNHIEEVLSPFSGVSTKSLPQDEHSVLIAASYDVGCLLTKPKQLHFNISLYGIDLRFNSLFGLESKDWVATITRSSEADGLTKIPNQTNKPVSIQKKPQIDKIIQFCKSIYHGFTCSLSLSECSFNCESDQSKISLDSQSLLVEQCNEYTQKLSAELSEIQMRNFMLAERKEELTREVMQLTRDIVQPPKKK